MPALRPRPRSQSRKPPINRYIAVLLAIVTGILHLALTPFVAVNDVHPSLVVVSVTLVTALFGFELGVIWAFAAGLTVTLMAFEPLGTTPLVLLIVCAVVAAAGRAFGRLTWVFPIAAALVGSLLADLLTLGLFRLTGTELRVPDLASLIVPAAVFNAVLAAVLLFPTRLAAARATREDTSSW